jgi:PEP-CTERM/exosortase A-associated glycosyltransferase
MAMRILHVLDHSIPLHSGYTFRTLSILREQRRLGWETFHFTGPKQIDCHADTETVDGLEFHRTPVESAPRRRIAGWSEVDVMRRIWLRLRQVVEEVRPDLLHVHSPVLNVLPALAVGRRLRLPVVYEVRAFWEDAAVDHRTTREGSLRYRLSHALETFALRRVDHVFTICDGLRQDIVARGIAAQKVTVIPNAVDVDAFTVGGEAEPALRARLGLEGCTVIGFVGSFYAYEGLDLLLDALPSVLAKRPDARVLLVGGGPQDAALRERAQRLGIADKVVFTGRVPHDEVTRYYDLVDVLAYPRQSMRLTELVTPLKPLEAMAQGRLVIASNVGGHRELIRDGNTGVLFEAGSASSFTERLLGLLDDSASWPRLRSAGRQFVEQERNWRASVARYASVYARLTAQSAATPARTENAR